MAEKEQGVALTIVLCVALVAGNWWVIHLWGSIANWFVLWPVAFILCAWIAGRFFRGHDTL